MSDVTGFLAVLAVGLVVFFAVVGIPIWAGTYYTQKSACANWGEQTNRETKFRVLVQPLGLPFKWDCFTPVGEGRWLPIDRVREFDE
jgi:hypothetical protein